MCWFLIFVFVSWHLLNINLFYESINFKDENKMQKNKLVKTSFCQRRMKMINYEGAIVTTILERVYT